MGAAAARTRPAQPLRGGALATACPDVIILQISHLYAAERFWAHSLGSLQAFSKTERRHHVVAAVDSRRWIVIPAERRVPRRRISTRELMPNVLSGPSDQR